MLPLDELWHEVEHFTETFGNSEEFGGCGLGGTKEIRGQV